MGNDQGSGLELDDTRPRRRQEPSRSLDPAETFGSGRSRRGGAAPSAAPGSHRPVMPKRDDEEMPTDSVTSGAFIVIALVHLLGGVALAATAPPGSAMILLAASLVSALVTFVAYYITGFLTHHFGVIALILFGGWFSLLVGLVAQLVHQLLPWLTWKVFAVAVVVAFGFAAFLDMR